MSNREKPEVKGELGLKDRPILKLVSYNLIYFGFLAPAAFFSNIAQYFYTVEVGLPIILFTVAYIIFGIWDAINDPFVGFLSDRTYFFTKKVGRRFPWIVIGAFPVAFLVYVVFIPPNTTNAAVLFAFFIIFALIYEFFLTSSMTNWWALYPQMFRTARDRRFSTGMELTMWGISLIFGLVVPPLFVQYGNKASFGTAALVVVLFTLPFIILGIPGVHEDKEMREKVIKVYQDTEKLKYFTFLKKIILKRNFLAMVILWVTIGVYATTLFGSTFFYVRYVLKGDVGLISILILIYVICAVAAGPFWIWLNSKSGEVRNMKIIVTGIFLASMPLIFIRVPIIVMINYAILGFFSGGFQVTDEVLNGSMFDEVVVREGKNVEGGIQGILVFLLRFSGPIGVVIISSLQLLTGFDPLAAVQTPLAEFGIVAAMVLIPGIIAFVGMFAWWKLWNLTEERRKELKLIMAERGL